MKQSPSCDKKKPAPHYPTFWSWLSHTWKYIAYFIAQVVFSFFQYHVVWRLNGTLRQLTENQRPENYERSVQVLRIIFTYRYDVFVQPPSLVDFFLVHEKFDHPERVLKDNVDLYSVDDKQTVFTEAEEGVQQWRNEYGAFLRVTQYQQAVRVIILPLLAASRLSDKVGDPKARLVFLSNTTRCGGTLLGQVFERTNKCVVFSEPGALQQIAKYELNQMSKEKLDKITRTVIRLFCKRVKFPKEVVAYVFKPLAGTLEIMPAICRVYPEAKHLFCYRDIKIMANSCQKLRFVSPLLHLAWWAGSKSTFIMKQISSKAGVSNNSRRTKLAHPLDLGFRIWGLSLRRYLDMRQQGVEIAGFLYDDLIKNKRCAIENLFKFTGLPTELIDAAVKGLDKDSQTNSGVSTKDLNQYADYDLDSTELLALNRKIIAMFDLPTVDGVISVEGTISAHGYMHTA